jgi:hypothetical protein
MQENKLCCFDTILWAQFIYLLTSIFLVDSVHAECSTHSIYFIIDGYLKFFFSHVFKVFPQSFIYSSSSSTFFKFLFFSAL